ncbi:hypothetical protein T11_10749 [Trichinella zimbabwensis]|uniref:Uncharacterized protein n=1 Tax=Trichinella zimbabwensis TaxID=268475 RepID=A0A0V1GLC5_9BILA|nr:hypothetical protein T11_10749 [Trichinella zimbabwensis]
MEFGKNFHALIQSWELCKVKGAITLHVQIGLKLSIYFNIKIETWCSLIILHSDCPRRVLFA